jgi:UDP-glucose 4-epimerase
MTPDGNSPTIAVTGAAGYIGSRVLSIMQTERPDWGLVAIDNQYRGQVTQVDEVAIDHVDIRDRRRLEAALDGADVVIHLAAISGVVDCERNADLAYQVNVTGTNNVAWFCRKTGAAMAFPFSVAVLGDPTSFPITTDLPRNPLNWYGRTKLLNERAIETLAADAFPAHLFLKSNLYGDHRVGNTVVSKPAVISFLVERAIAREPLTVYKPGTQSRNFVHVKDVARVYLKSTDALLDQLDAGVTGTATYEVASDQDLSILRVAERVQAIAAEEFEWDVEVTLVENPRFGETMVEEFAVDTTSILAELGWKPSHSIEESIRELLRRRL